MKLTPDRARELFAAARVVRLATVGADAVPHLVPMVFAVTGDVIHSAVDAKPKRTTALRRLANVTANPAVTVLADHYVDDDWTALWWVRADGLGRVVDPADTDAAQARAVLAERYAQYREAAPTGPVLRIEVTRWTGWSAG